MGSGHPYSIYWLEVSIFNSLSAVFVCNNIFGLTPEDFVCQGNIRRARTTKQLLCRGHSAGSDHAVLNWGKHINTFHSVCPPNQLTVIFLLVHVCTQAHMWSVCYLAATCMGLAEITRTSDALYPLSLYIIHDTQRPIYLLYLLIYLLILIQKSFKYIVTYHIHHPKASLPPYSWPNLHSLTHISFTVIPIEKCL